MRVAESYSGYEFDETKAFEKNGKLYVNAKMKCDRCTGGVYVTRVENGVPVPHPAYGGVCLKCEGTGVIDKVIRLYTDKEFETMERAKLKASEKREEERKEKMDRDYAQKLEKWLDNNSFNKEMKTYVYFPEDSYDVKDELKDAGFRFSQYLFWHCPIIPEGYEDKVVEVALYEVAVIAAWGEGLYQPDVKQIVMSKMADARPTKENTSEWLGEEKERLYDIPVTLISIREMETKYGYTQLVKFETEEGNLIQWWTTVDIPFEKGDRLLLTGTIKKHDEYNGIKSTVMTRCKMKEV